MTDGEELGVSEGVEEGYDKKIVHSVSKALYISRSLIIVKKQFNSINILLSLGYVKD